MIDSASILDLFADRHGDRHAAGRGGMAAYLKCLLAESAGHLARAGAGARLPTARREAVATLIHDVCHLRDGMTRPVHPPLDDALRAGAGLPAITRATLDDLERAGLFVAFRDRCATLGDRLADPERADAALAELCAGMRVLARGPVS
ncbi:MAG: hypothetical protein HZA24_05485 [Nitrospirae bacterium]|nr:hypothetical protein [Nitrospirota bacterium]